MARFAILRVHKLRKAGNIGGSSQHGLRERNTENADPARLLDNEVLCGPKTSQGILAAVNKRLAVATHKSTQDPVQCLEYLFAYSPEASIGRAPGPYFRDSLAWLQERHGKENVVSAIVHHDESTAHMAAYAVPIDVRGGKERKRNVADGRNPDGTQRRKVITQVVGAEVWLSAAAYVGSRAKLRQLQTDFAQQVGKKHGLVRGVENSGARHTTIKEFYGFLRGEIPPGFGAEYGKLAKAAQAEALRQKAAAEVSRKKQEELEEQLEKMQLRLAEQEREAALRLEQQRREAARTIEEYRTTIEKLGDQLREKTRLISQQIRRVWAALFAGGVHAASEALLDVNQALEACDLDERPEFRIDVRELADGGWRGAVIDINNAEVWCEIRSDYEDALAAAEEWIQSRSAPAPGA